MSIKNYGFTLVEIMVSLAVFALLLTILLSSFNLTIKSWNVSEGLVESQQNARVALDWMSMEMHEAVNYSEMTASMFYPAISYSLSSNSTSFTKPASAAEISAGDFALQTIKYYVENNDLKRQVNTGTPYVIASNIDYFTVEHLLEDPTDTYNYPDNIYDPKYFSITVATKTYGIDSTKAPQRYSMITKVRLRNNP
ncbi:MAG: type II secretion system protein J [bacterium]